MKRALITGMAGFVGGYLKDELQQFGREVFGFDREDGDIKDLDFVERIVEEVKPDEVYHLAGFSSVGASFDNPQEVMDVNVGGTRNLLEAVRKFGGRVLLVSSAEVYGKCDKIPISEDESVKVTSPYSESRIEQEALVQEFEDVVVSRSFNHTGVGRPDNFVLASFVLQAAKIVKGLQDPVMKVGDLSVVRDFSDVRDVVRAYRLLMDKGASGEVYNVGSGKGYSLKDLLDRIIQISGVEVDVQQDPARMRPVDIPELVADISKITMKIDWRPVYSMDKTLEEMFNAAVNKI